MIELEMFEREENENNKEYAYRLLRSNIMTLKLVPGTSLNENEICKILNMSRTPVHEAITTLKEEWLVEVVPQSGTKVTLINPALIREGYHTRVLLESSLLENFAGKLSHVQSEEIFRQLNKQQEVMNQIGENPDLCIRLDDEFHCMVYNFGGRGYTWQAIRGLMSHYDRARYLDAMIGDVDAEKIVHEHRQIYGYMLMGLPPDKSANEIVLGHLGYFGDKFYRIIEKYHKYFEL
ncbi:MAG: GntR family transcriptional regulator [Eubacteriales bacterium]